MTVHTAYEVRVRRNTQWLVEAIFDDEILALAAAKKVEARAGLTPVVVIQEIYDVARNHLKSRSVYRSTVSQSSAPELIRDSDGAGKKSSLLVPLTLGLAVALGLALVL